MAEQFCKGDHEKHICKLAEVNKFDDIAGMVQEARFICSNCGRAAHGEENLCNAVAIERLKYM